MKKHFKFLVALLSAILLLVVGFTVSALATEEAPEVTLAPIPEENADLTFHLWNTATGEYMHGADRLCYDASKASIDTHILNALYTKTGNYLVKMTKDYTFQGKGTDANGTEIAGDSFNQLSVMKGNITIDLGGHTLTFTKTMALQAKSSNTPTFSFQNGNIVLNTSQSGSILEVNARSGATEFNVNFENITFRPGASRTEFSTAFLVRDTATAASSTGTPYTGVCTSNITLKNCTFDLSNLSKSVTLFKLGVESDRVKNTVTMIGGQIIGNASKINIWSETGNVSAFSFKKGENGYPVLKDTARSATVIHSETAFDTDTDVQRYLLLDNTDDTYSYYRLGTKNEYGYIPAKYEDTEAHPILIFNMSKKYAIISFNQWGGETSTTYQKDENDEYVLDENDNKIIVSQTFGGALEYVKNNKSTSHTILFQSDFKTTQTYFNTGALTGTHTVDLGGHTVTLGAIFLYGQMKTATATCNLIIKNGTIDVNKNTFLGNGISSKIANKICNYTIENVNFVNISSGGKVVADGISSGSEAEANAHFINCRFDTSADYEGPMFRIGTVAQSKVDCDVHIFIEGGKFIIAGEALPTFYQNVLNRDDKSIVYKEYNGAYPTVTVVNGVDTASSTYPAENGATLALRKTAQGETQTTYTMTPAGFASAYLNLTNSLNFVYRVFVPASYTAPVMTFTVGTSVVEVTAFKTENGYALYRLPNITPARMGEIITATLSATVGEETVTLTHNTLSVKAYIEVLKALEEEKEEEKRDTALITLVDNLLVYGAAAQQYEGQSADTFVTEIGEIAEIPENTGVLTFTGTTSEKGGIGYFGVNLDGAFAIRLGVQANVAGLTLVAKCGEEEVVYNLDDYTAKDGIITIVYDGILANELDTEVTFTLMDGEEVVGKVLTANINAYLARVCDGADANLATLAKALYAYGESAKNYAQ